VKPDSSKEAFFLFSASHVAAESDSVTGIGIAADRERTERSMPQRYCADSLPPESNCGKGEQADGKSTEGENSDAKPPVCDDTSRNAANGDDSGGYSSVGNDSVRGRANRQERQPGKLNRRVVRPSMPAVGLIDSNIADDDRDNLQDPEKKHNAQYLSPELARIHRAITEFPHPGGAGL
jgi:hypothetical protein